MAASGRGAVPAVKDLLFEESYRFEFFQAVRILERLRPERVPVGEGSEPDDEIVRFCSRVSVAFPASDIQEMTEKAPTGAPDRMLVNFMGLAGVTGPLPLPYTELILERQHNKDTAIRDFLDIFNHRLVSLLYRVRKIHRPAFEYKAPDQTHFAAMLFSFMGLGTKGLRNRMRIKDRALLFYTELLAQKPRSMKSLEQVLTHYFQVRMTGVPLAGEWRFLEEGQVTLLGAGGQNAELGYSAVLGTRVWDQQGKFQVEAGPLNIDQFMDFLPIGTAFAPICELVRFFAGIEYEYDVVLLLDHRQVPGSVLGGRNGPRLGWTSWLKTKPYEEDYGRVRLSPRLLADWLDEGRT